MSEISAEQKIADLKLGLTSEILSFYKERIRRAINYKSPEIFKTLKRNLVSAEENKMVITLNQEEWTQIVQFFRIAEEQDLVNSSYSSEDDKIDCARIKTKEDILKKL